MEKLVANASVLANVSQYGNERVVAKHWNVNDVSHVYFAATSDTQIMFQSAAQPKQVYLRYSKISGNGSYSNGCYSLRCFVPPLLSKTQAS